MTNVYHPLYGSENLPLKIGTTALSCYILDNGQQVFTKSSVYKALGYDAKSEDWLFDLLGSINKFHPVSGAVFDVLEKPVLFEIQSRNGNTKRIKGIPASLFLEVCHTIANAKSSGYLNLNQLKFGKAAEAILKGIGKQNLDDLIGEATGFFFMKEHTKNQLQDFLLKNSGDDVFHWVRTFPDALFEALRNIHSLQWSDLKNQPQPCANILHEIIFSRLSDDMLQELRTRKPKRTYKSKTGRIQDIQHPELKVYTTVILSLLNAAANNWTIFIQLLNRIYPKNKELVSASIFTGPDQKVTETLTELDKIIRKGVMINKVYKKTR